MEDRFQAVEAQEDGNMVEFIALDVVIFLILITCIAGVITLFWKYLTEKHIESKTKNGGENK